MCKSLLSIVLVVLVGNSMFQSVSSDRLQEDAGLCCWIRLKYCLGNELLHRPQLKRATTATSTARSARLASVVE